jgi:hypothetical protein
MKKSRLSTDNVVDNVFGWYPVRISDGTRDILTGVLSGSFHSLQVNAYCIKKPN